MTMLRLKKFKFLLWLCSDYITKLQTFCDYFVVRQGLFAGYSRQKVKIARTITANSAIRKIFTAYLPDIRKNAAFP